MAVRRRIREPVKKHSRPRVPGPTEGAAAQPRSGLWNALREIDHLLEGIDEMLGGHRGD